MKFVDEQDEGVSPTLSALRVYREHRAAGRRGLPPDAPHDFAPAALQPVIRHNCSNLVWRLVNSHHDSALTHAGCVHRDLRR